jgi:hypothetical protein
MTVEGLSALAAGWLVVVDRQLADRYRPGYVGPVDKVDAKIQKHAGLVVD